MEKINYVIPTWSGTRRVPNKNYLKDHILKLSTLEHNLSQVTIVKPIFPGHDDEYYNIRNLDDEIGCDVVILDRHSNLGESYGQLFYAYETYKDEFDYYIFCEDDYLPHIDNFDSLLLERKNDEGYLCSFCGVNDEYPDGGCSISNGIISTTNMEKIYESNPNPINRIGGRNGNDCHKNFADLLIECGLNFKDFADEFRVPYFGGNIIDYGRIDGTSEVIFTPNQLLNHRINFKSMKEEDLSFFLEVRNQSTEYLHNDTKFTLEEATKWFNDTKPEYFIIKLGSKSIGYFRTSNWSTDKTTLYLGCDIHPNYRGYGFAQKAYIEMIDSLYLTMEITSIKLEVLANNDRAKHIYTKIGFVEIGISDEKVKKGDTEIDSLIMEYKR